MVEVVPAEAVDLAVEDRAEAEASAAVDPAEAVSEAASAEDPITDLREDRAIIGASTARAIITVRVITVAADALAAFSG